MEYIRTRLSNSTFAISRLSRLQAVLLIAAVGQTNDNPPSAASAAESHPTRLNATLSESLHLPFLICTLDIFYRLHTY